MKHSNISLNKTRGSRNKLLSNNVKLLAFLFASFLPVSFSNAQEGRFQFNGSFVDHPNASFRILLDYDPSNRLEDSVAAEGKADSSGNFETKFEITEGQAFVLMIDRTIYRLWAEPGNDLAISITVDQEVSCKGSLSEQNQFLFDSQLAIPSQSVTNTKFDATEFLQSIDVRSESQLQRLEDASAFFGKKGRFYLYSKAQIVGWSARQKNIRPMLAKRKKELSKAGLPVDYYAFWDSFPILDDSAAMLSRSYQTALQAKFQFMAEQALKTKGVVPANDIVCWTKKELEIQSEQLKAQPKTNELLFASKIMFMIQYMPPTDTMVVMEDFSNKFPTSPYSEYIHSAFAKSQSIDLKAIDTACEFRDANGSRVSFSDLKDKVIYIDFWGLWCKACVAQQPDLDKLIKELSADEDVVVLSINFHDSLESWTGFVASNEPKGMHWKPATVADEAKAKELFLLSSFPRFMIFGKGGKLISASAPIPSQDGLGKMLIDAMK